MTEDEYEALTPEERKNGSATYYTAKPSPETGEYVYDSGANAVGSVKGVCSGGSYITVNGIYGSYTRLPNVSFHSLAQDGGVGITLTSTTGGVQRSLVIPVHGNRQGLQGTAGPMLYPAGRWVARQRQQDGKGVQSLRRQPPIRAL